MVEVLICCFGNFIESVKFLIVVVWRGSGILGVVNVGKG